MSSDLLAKKTTQTKSTTQVPVWVSAIPGIMAPKMRSFDQVLDAREEESKHSERSDSGEPSTKEGSEKDNGKRKADDYHRQKIQSALEGSWAEQSSRQNTKRIQVHQHHEQFIQNREQAHQTTQKSEQKHQVSLHALQAEQSMQEIEEAADPNTKREIPSEMVDELVSHLTSYRLNDQQKGLKAILHQHVLGGALNIRVEQDGKGGLVIAFDGDEKALQFLQAHQDELKEVLHLRGFSFALLFA